MLLRSPSVPRFETLEPQHDARTWSELGLRDFSALWRALHGHTCPPKALAVARTMFANWGEAPIGGSAWRSQISDDGTPWELSVTHAEGTTRTRLLVEAQGAEPTWSSTVEAGLRLTAALLPYGAGVGRFERVRELMLPRDGGGTFGLWHAVDFVDGPPLFKVYLNPQVRGLHHASAVVEEAFTALGMRESFASVLEASHRGDDVDEIRYFSVDLDDSAAARVKVYFAHERATADELERVFALASDYVPGRARSLCETIGGGPGPFEDLPISTCLAFVAGRARPTSVTAHFPVRAYVRDDARARERITTWLRGQGIESSDYHAAVDAIAHRPLDAGVGLQSYVSTKSGPRGGCTIYLGSEALAVARPREIEARVPSPPHLPAVADIVAWGHALDFRNHPFFRRLEQTDAVVDPLYRLALNMRIGIAHRFTQWLAALIARVPDVGVRSILAHQLDDELGHGRGEDAHVHLFERMFDAVQAAAGPLPEDVDVTAPGRTFTATVEPWFTGGDPWVGVGMAALAEVAASQTDEVIARVFRRQHAVSHAELQWAFLHDELEQSHAQDSDSIVRGVPDDPAVHEAMWRGARLGARALWVLLDDLYPVCFDR